jgi:hypothetical protein
VGSYDKFWGPTALYRLFDADGALLYVGIANSPESRWSQHAKTKEWWHLVADKTICWFDTRVVAADAEIKAIQAERPRFNIMHAPLASGSSAPDRTVGLAVKRVSTTAVNANFARYTKVARDARFELGELPIVYVELHGEATAALVPAWVGEWVEQNAEAVLTLIESGEAPKID